MEFYIDEECMIMQDESLDGNCTNTCGSDSPCMLLEPPALTVNVTGHEWSEKTLEAGIPQCDTPDDWQFNVFCPDDYIGCIF